ASNIRRRVIQIIECRGTEGSAPACSKLQRLARSPLDSDCWVKSAAEITVVLVPAGHIQFQPRHRERVCWITDQRQCKLRENRSYAAPVALRDGLLSRVQGVCHVVEQLLLSALEPYRNLDITSRHGEQGPVCDHSRGFSARDDVKRKIPLDRC